MSPLIALYVSNAFLAYLVDILVVISPFCCNFSFFDYDVFTCFLMLELSLKVALCTSNRQQVNPTNIDNKKIVKKKVLLFKCLTPDAKEWYLLFKRVCLSDIVAQKWLNRFNFFLKTQLIVFLV